MPYTPKTVQDPLLMSMVAAAVLLIGSVWYTRSKEQKSSYPQLEMRCIVSQRAGSIPPSINQFSFSDMLTDLDISNCGLKMLPNEITTMVSLQKLNAAKNNLTSLPNSFKHLVNLRVAFFLGCNFTSIPSVLDSLAPSIGWLILSDNQVTSLPESIGRLKGLRKLMLAGNRLQALPSSFAQCQSLELIRLADNQLAKFPQALLKLPKLAWIALAANDFNRSQNNIMENVKEVQGDVEIDHTQELGRGASGVVYQGYVKARNSGDKNTRLKVAVKVFKDAKTSDGTPLDEMAAAAMGGSTSCKHLMQSYGRLPRSAIQGKVVIDDLGLVLEYLDGFKVLAEPPSFDSVTRDQYNQNQSFAFKTVKGVLMSICEAAMTLHRLGIAHGDLYGHNVLFKGGCDGDGFSILSDFGASFFYKSPSSTLSKEDEACLERVEVLAFGYLMTELLDRVERGSRLDTGVAAMKKLAGECCCQNVLLRPSFETALQVLKRI